MTRATLLALLAACPSMALGAEAADRPPEEQRILGMEDASVWLDLGRMPPGATLDLDLVAAEVDVIPARGDRMEVLVARLAGGADISRLRLRLRRSQGVTSLIDLFPQRATGLWTRECLPPDGERGDLWTVPGAYRMRIRLPISVRLAARTGERGVRDRRPPGRVRSGRM